MLRFRDHQATLAFPMRPSVNCAAGLLSAATLVAATVNAAPISVEQSERRQVVQVVLVSGTVTSPQSAVLSPSVGGLIERIDVDAGDRVEAGDVVVALDRELDALDLERARAEEAQARSELQDSRRRLAEAERVGPERGIPETQIKSLRAEVARDEAALTAAEAAARQQAAVVRRHDVRAPFSGVISERYAEVGEWVAPGDGLVELVATDRLRFDFRVPQSYYARLDKDTGVVLSLDAVPANSIPGRIQAIVPVKNPNDRTFLLRVVADSETNRSVTPGMSARARIRIDTGREAVVVPRDALLLYPDGRKTVWVADAASGETTVREQRVEAGVEFDGFVEIRSGLDAGMIVVTRGNEALQNGQTVQIR
jgi:membrane fusion protein (multidrug efflux system)